MNCELLKILTESVLPDSQEIDEQQKKANDMMDAAQSMLNDIIDTLQGKEEDME